MKIKIKIITITILTLIAVGLISALFIIQYNTPNEVEETSLKDTLRRSFFVLKNYGIYVKLERN